MRFVSLRFTYLVHDNLIFFAAGLSFAIRKLRTCQTPDGFSLEPGADVSLCGRIRNAPMGRHRLTRPHRANFFGCIVTDGENKIDLKPLAARLKPPGEWSISQSQV